jgi:hypothetical protein
MSQCSAGGYTITCRCGCGIICSSEPGPGDEPRCEMWCEDCPEPEQPGGGQAAQLPKQPAIIRVDRRSSGRSSTLDADAPVEIQVDGVSVAGLAQVLDALLKEEVCLPLRRGSKRLRATRRKTTVRDFAQSVGLVLNPARSTSKRR